MSDVFGTSSTTLLFADDSMLTHDSSFWVTKLNGLLKNPKEDAKQQIEQVHYEIQKFQHGLSGFQPNLEKYRNATECFLNSCPYNCVQKTFVELGDFRTGFPS